MGFFERLKNGWTITKASLNFIKTDPEFLVLPIAVGIIMLFVLASFFVSTVFLRATLGNELLYGFLAIYYLVSFSLLYFIQAMVLEAARLRFAGKNPTLAGAFDLAMKKIRRIFALAVIASVISIISAVLRERGESKGGLGGLLLQFLGAAVGISWSIVSYFSLPVLLYEDVGVIDSFKRSVDLFKKTWGENVTANFTLGVVYFPGLVLLLLGIIVLFVIPAIGFVIILLSFALLIMGAVVGSVAKSVIAEALYEYASTGKVPNGMPEQAVKNFYSK